MTEQELKDGLVAVYTRAYNLDIENAKLREALKPFAAAVTIREEKHFEGENKTYIIDTNKYCSNDLITAHKILNRTAQEGK